MPKPKLKKLSRASRLALEAFDAAARGWGWFEDQGNGDTRERDAFLEYEAAHERLRQRLLKLEESKK
jgi:hypothetical protein